MVLDNTYRIDKKLGEGGMGAVFQATHLRLGKTVAIKVMARVLAENTEALKRFHREAVVTSGLGHPHIVSVNDFSTTPAGEPFFVMEFLQGEDLDHRLRRLGRMSPDQVVHIVKQVASALSATHANAVVHRDLKPGNIYLLNAAGTPDFVKVLDFGISKVRTATTKLTQAAAVIGTPQYMSPEQALGKVDQVDERTDQWALACIAWECLSGQSPFTGETVPSILFQVVHEPPASLVPQVAGLPADVETVLRRALAKDKNSRFASVDEFSTALELALQSTSASSSQSPAGLPGTGKWNASAAQAPAENPKQVSTFSRTAGEVHAVPSRAAPVGRNRAWWIAGGVGVCLALSAVILVKTRSIREQGPSIAADREQPLQAQDTSEAIAIRADDLKRVDAADIIIQAMAVVCRQKPECTLSYAYFGGISGGWLDTIGGSTNVLVTVSYRAVDNAKPPGQDVDAGSYQVRVREGKLYFSHNQLPQGPHPVDSSPKCSFARAWESVVGSGVPGNAVVDAYYREGFGGRDLREKAVWYIRVNGHPEWDHQVDGTSCELLK